MNLFALIADKQKKIKTLKFSLDSILQERIKEEFKKQKQNFFFKTTEEIKFDGRFNPDENQMLFIEDFNDYSYMIECIKNPLSVEKFKPKEHNLDMVKAIFTGCSENNNHILVQLFERKRLIKTDFLSMVLSSDTFQIMEDSGLTLDNKLLAILDGEKLKFRSFYNLRRAFDVDKYFKEATSQEVINFATNDLLTTSNIQKFERSANSIVRKKIAIILKSNVLNNLSVEKIIDEGKLFDVDVKVSHGKIVLPENNSELLKLLRLLDEDYYKSSFTQKQFISNSKRPANPTN